MRIFSVSLSLIFCILLTIQTSAQGLLYTDSQSTYTFELPDGWQKRNDTDIDDIKKNDNRLKNTDIVHLFGSANSILSIREHSSGTTIYKDVNQSMKELRDLGIDGKIPVELIKDTMKDIGAEVTYGYVNQEDKIIMMRMKIGDKTALTVQFFSPQKSVQLTFTSALENFPKEENSYTKIIDSFRFTDTGTSTTKDISPVLGNHKENNTKEEMTRRDASIAIHKFFNNNFGGILLWVLILYGCYHLIQKRKLKNAVLVHDNLKDRADESIKFWSYKNFLSWKGRMSRGRYWSVFSISWGFMVSISFIVTFILFLFEGQIDSYMNGTISNQIELIILRVLVITSWLVYFSVSILFGILFFYTPIVTGAKRCHDCGNSGWYQCIPIYGPLMVMFFRGTQGVNKFGPPTESTEI